MRALKIAIIGAGSSYTPELIQKLSEMKESLFVKSIVLQDIDGKRLEIMQPFCERFAKRIGFDCEFSATLDQREAIRDSHYVITQLRVGGNQARSIDEKVPNSYGLIGQETTGAGGFMKALRTIPVMLSIANDVCELAPDAWIINYTNPTGIITEAVLKYTKAKIAGLCAGGLFPRNWTANALKVPKDTIHYEYAGLNHMNFAYNISVNGIPITEEAFHKVCEEVMPVNSGLLKKIGAVSSPYLQYYFHTAKCVKEEVEAEKTRGEQVQELEKIVYAGFADQNNDQIPVALEKRGGGGYSEVAIGIIHAIENNKDTSMVVNVQNKGVLSFLPDDAVIEAVCMVNAAGIKPITISSPPKSVWGLIASVKCYEQLTVEAAYSGSKDTALLALMAHPLIRDFETAEPLLNELLDKNKVFLERFYHE